MLWTVDASVSVPWLAVRGHRGERSIRGSSVAALANVSPIAETDKPSTPGVPPDGHPLLARVFSLRGTPTVSMPASDRPVMRRYTPETPTSDAFAGKKVVKYRG